jgi:RNA polymerase sigma-70 factor, ECF subfamily
MSTMTPPIAWEEEISAGRSTPKSSTTTTPSAVLDALSLQTATTAELVQAAQRGDREAFGQLFLRYERQVMAVALRRLHDFGDAQELCQDVFVQAMQKVTQLREPEAFGGWLRAITQRMAVNRLVRQRHVQEVDPETLECQLGDDQTPEDLILASERAASVRAGLAQLGALDRQTLVAFYVEGRSLLEMSDVFQAPLGTIKRRLHVARKRLAKQMESLVAV